MLHVHGNVVDSEENLWTKHISESIAEAARSQGIVCGLDGYIYVS